jgi:hypothetical protein
MLKSVLIICSSLLFAGCISLQPKASITWVQPPKPQTEKVEFIAQRGGYFVTDVDSIQLADNIDELKAYIEKLEVLIKEMLKYYE